MTVASEPGRVGYDPGASQVAKHFKLESSLEGLSSPDKAVRLTSVRRPG